MPNVFDKAQVPVKGYSLFETPKEHKLTAPIGRVVPVYYRELAPGDEIDINLSHLIRFTPMLAPIMHRFTVDFVPMFCPFRLLNENGKIGGLIDYEKFFNPATPDSERPAMPMVSAKELYGDSAIIGSLFDYLHYPTFSFVIRNWQSGNWVFASIVNQDKIETLSSVADLDFGGQIDLSDNLRWQEFGRFFVTSDGTVAGLEKVSYGLFSYWIHRYAVENNLSYDNPVLVRFLIDGGSKQSIFENVLTFFGLKVNEAYNIWLSYLLQQWFSTFGANSVLDTHDLNLTRFLVYLRCMSDWFVNTNVFDGDDLYEFIVGDIATDVLDLGNSLPQMLHLNYSDNADWSYLGGVVDSEGEGGTEMHYEYPFLFRSHWASDYFTSAYVSSQSGTAVAIPVNGNILQLRWAERLQWFREKVMIGGKRLIDQIFVHRGVKSSDLRNHRVEVLGHMISNLQVSDVLQTSQSDIDSSLGDFAGHGITMNQDHLCHYRCEEFGAIMVVMRVRPRAEYMDAVPKDILKSDYYDYQNPDFDNVGMQAIKVKELFYSPLISNPDRNFGFQRRYTEYMTDIDQISGDFKTDFGYWHAAREIDSEPSLNGEFITMNPDKDGYNRIFAVPGNPRPVVAQLWFDVKCTRQLSRYIDFSL